MSKKDLQRDIRNSGGFILSDGTLDVSDLLAKSYDLMIAYNLRPNIYGYTQEKSIFQEIVETLNATKLSIPRLTTEVYYNRAKVSKDKEEQAYMLWEDITDYFQEIAPSGYYFGASEGDGACIGWFKFEE